MRFHNKFKDYATICSLGIIAGILTRLTDFLSMDSLWSFPTIASLYGFWIVTVTLIIWRSTSHLTAGLNTFFYLFCMTVAFYGLQYILGKFIPRFELNAFPIGLCLIYCIASVLSGIAASLLYFWNKKGRHAAVLMALPIGALAGETIAVLIQLQHYHTHLFQLMFNAGFCLYIGIQFRKNTKYKELYTVTTIAVAALIFYFIYKPCI